jgi:UDP:flavonoid glycosyltransferase YjiC (YdhE family)
MGDPERTGRFLSARRLLVAISGHGYGHAAQTAPVIAELVARDPSIEIILRSSLPEPVLRDFFPSLSAISVSTVDFGAAMRSPFEVNAEATARRYAGLHARYHAILAAEAAELTALKPDLVFCNVSYVTLAAAAQLGLPSIALCSLDWLSIYRHFCGDRREAAAVMAQMREGYGAADCFLAPAPSMPMTDIAVTPIGPVARIDGARAAHRQQLADRLNLQPDERIVLVSLGGVAGGFDPTGWRPIEGVRLIVAGVEFEPRPGIFPSAEIGLDHLALLAASDAIVCKPGYGSFVEAACHGVPVLYAPRFDWPEEPALVDWLGRSGTARAISRAAIEAGELGEALSALWAQSRKPAIEPSGNQSAAQRVLAALG